MSDQPTQNPAHAAAAADEGFLLIRAENAYLRQRTVALNVQARELTAEVERLRSLLPDDETKETGEDADSNTPEED